MSDHQDQAPVVGVHETTDAAGRIVKSSKRLYGAILISAGGALLLGIGIASIFRQVADPQTGLSAGQALIITGAALLGVGVLDGVGQLIGGRSATGDK